MVFIKTTVLLSGTGVGDGSRLGMTGASPKLLDFSVGMAVGDLMAVDVASRVSNTS
jgi:hypothetical protein